MAKAKYPLGSVVSFEYDGEEGSGTIVYLYTKKEAYYFDTDAVVALDKEYWEQFGWGHECLITSAELIIEKLNLPNDQLFWSVPFIRMKLIRLPGPRSFQSILLEEFSS